MQLTNLYAILLDASFAFILASTWEEMNGFKKGFV
jgi:hypothetical protein